MKNRWLVFLIICFQTTQVGIAQSVNSLPVSLTSIASRFHNPRFNEHVFVFDPSMDMNTIQSFIDTLYKQQHPRSSEFGLNRYALLFKPGKYKVDLKLGYYMHVIGLGSTPDEVVINGSLISRGQNNGNVTCNFWRSVENIYLNTHPDSMNIWGVSQAAPMRRVHIKGDIKLHDDGWASGGFIADSKFDGTVFAGSQQQWFSRNADFKKWEQGNWNIMFMGSHQTPPDKWPDNPYTVLTETPWVREKPYLVYEDQGLKVKIPQLKKNSTGISWNKVDPDENTIPIDSFYIVRPEFDNSETINAALAQGKNLLFNPGIYKLRKSIRITRPGTLVMGIGLPTLTPLNGNRVMEIADVDGITVCGLIMDAGKNPSEKLMVLGEYGSSKSHEANPTFLFDIFIRVGGFGEGSALVCLEINSHDVVVDHTWLWRADHGKGVGWDLNKSNNGLVVNGDRVTVYGLFCEHFQQYQTLWKGNHGRVFFYQCEMPYDPPTPEAFKNGAINGYASYKVSDSVTSHEAWGLGIYCVFFKAPVIVDNAIETPAIIENNIHHKIIYWLFGGNKDSAIKSVINGKGAGVNINNVQSRID